MDPAVAAAALSDARLPRTRGTGSQPRRSAEDSAHRASGKLALAGRTANGQPVGRGVQPDRNAPGGRGAYPAAGMATGHESGPHSNRAPVPRGQPRVPDAEF